MDLESYDSDYDDVDEYLSDEDTPIDYKKSAAKGAIEHRQKNKRNGSGVINDTPPSEQTNHMTKITDGEGRETVTQNVNNKRHGKPHTKIEQERSNDPADW